MIAWERAAGAPAGWEPGATGAGDDVDWFFRARVDAPEDARLVFEGIATSATVAVDGEVVAESSSMWMPVVVPVAPGTHEVVVHCRALGPLLAQRRKPRARWRTAVCDNALRFHRTTLLGRAPGFAPGPPVVGLWRPARLVVGPDPLDGVTLTPRLDGDDGVLDVRAPDGTEVELVDTGSLRVPQVRRWMPWTHGTPHRYEVRVRRGGAVATRWVGFRTLESVGEALDVRVNGVGVFVRGAVWTPVPSGEERRTLEALRDLGLNAVRVVGTGAYESAAFHDLCDELGLLVWQDLMFANLDYPFADPAFRAACREEVAHQASVVAGRPSLAVVCGNSESEQQVAMLGLDPAMARTPFFDTDVPELLADLDAIYLPSAPSGPGRPFRPDAGVANWFGVGGYRRPLGDVRRAGVRFASECLAFANPSSADPAGFVPRDPGADWDFADVRRFYLAELHGEAPAPAAEAVVTGEVMAEVFGDWRRAASACRGGFVLWARDRDAGPGWGLLDAAGAPKPMTVALADALAPVAVWTTDEGQSGIAAHVANDGPDAVSGALRVTVYRDGRHVVAEATVDVRVAPHGAWTADVEELLGRWIDVSYAYRFGPPQHDLVVTAFAGATHARRPSGPATPLGAAEAKVTARLDGAAVVVTTARALQRPYALVAGCAPTGAAVAEPGRPLRLPLRGTPTGPGRLLATNLRDTVDVG